MPASGRPSLLPNAIPGPSRLPGPRPSRVPRPSNVEVIDSRSLLPPLVFAKVEPPLLPVHLTEEEINARVRPSHGSVLPTCSCLSDCESSRTRSRSPSGGRACTGTTAAGRRSHSGRVAQHKHTRRLALPGFQPAVSAFRTAHPFAQVVAR